MNMEMVRSATHAKAHRKRVCELMTVVVGAEDEDARDRRRAIFDRIGRDAAEEEGAVLQMNTRPQQQQAHSFLPPA